MGEQWYCQIVGQEVGPVTSEDLISMLSRGQIDPDDPVRAGSSGPWRPVKEILGGTFPATGGTATATSVETHWFCRMLGDEFGPYTLKELREFAVQGQLSRKDEIRDGRSGPWVAAGEVAGIFDGKDAAAGKSSDDYGFLSDIAGLEDAGDKSKPTPKRSSRRSSDDLLAGMADLEDAGSAAPPASSRSTEDLLAGLADAEEPPVRQAPRAVPAREPAPPAATPVAAAPVPAPTPPGGAAPPPGTDPAALMGMLQSVAMMEMVQRLDSEYRRLRTQMAGGGPPIESPSWHGQPQWPGQAAPQGYAPQGYGVPPQQGWAQPPQPQGWHAPPHAPPQQGWAPPHPPAPGAPQWPAASPQAPAAPAAPAARPAATNVKLPPPPVEPPAPRPAAPKVEAPRPAQSSSPAVESTTPKPPAESGANRNAAADVMRDMAAAHIRSAQASARPAARSPYAPSSSKSSGGGMSFDFSSIDFTSKPFLIGAGVVGVLVLGYFAMSFGFLSGMSAGPVYDDTKKLYEEFKVASAKGSESPEFTTFYGSFKPKHSALMTKIGNPSVGSTAHKAKQAVSFLGSTVESFKMKLAKDEQEMYKGSLEQSLGQLKTEFGR